MKKSRTLGAKDIKPRHKGWGAREEEHEKEAYSHLDEKKEHNSKTLSEHFQRKFGYAEKYASQLAEHYKARHAPALYPVKGQEVVVRKGTNILINTIDDLYKAQVKGFTRTPKCRGRCFCS